MKFLFRMAKPIYIGEIICRLETRIHERLETCRRGELSKSAIAEHAWSNQPAIPWDKASILDRYKNQMVKEALRLQLNPTHRNMNRDVGMDLNTNMLGYNMLGYNMH